MDFSHEPHRALLTEFMEAILENREPKVNGRDELPIPDKVELDKVYLQKQSWLFDMQILLRTFVKVVRRDGVVH